MTCFHYHRVPVVGGKAGFRFHDEVAVLISYVRAIGAVWGSGLDSAAHEHMKDGLVIVPGGFYL